MPNPYDQDQPTIYTIVDDNLADLMHEPTPPPSVAIAAIAGMGTILGAIAGTLIFGNPAATIAAAVAGCLAAGTIAIVIATAAPTEEPSNE
jgi:NAD(P)H-hydrate repair Nnr-like enzyme with NAD(P)H-hydrate dehydratase domain